MAKPTGPFGTAVFGPIEGHRVRMDFLTEPANGTCTVLLMSNQEALPDQSSAPTFEEAIQTYQWAAAVDALALD